MHGLSAKIFVRDGTVYFEVLIKLNYVCMQRKLFLITAITR
jgi:hypothetical protein